MAGEPLPLTAEERFAAVEAVRRFGQLPMSERQDIADEDFELMSEWLVPSGLAITRLADRDRAAAGELDVERLAQEWERTAERIMERAMQGDPAVSLAIAKTLRSCAARLREQSGGRDG